MSDPNIVFVYGALRSGTTLFRLILDTHPALHNPGEADFLFDFLQPDPGHPTGWRYDRTGLAAHRIFRAKGIDLDPDLDGLDLLRDMIARLADQAPDKVLTLNLHRHAARMAEILPGARVIHMLRDPRDVARSCVGMGWAGISYHGVNSWLRTEQDWARAAPRLAADRVLTLRYEDLMRDIEAELRKICTFLGVPYDAEMLRYHETTTYGPPDPGLAEQWRRKATPREVALLEGRLGDLLTGRGYLPAGPAPHRPGALERVALDIENRLRRWRHNIRRFGLPLFVSSHAARLLGLRGLQHRLDARIEGKVIRDLK